MSEFALKPGLQFAVTYEVVRLAATGEILTNPDGTTEPIDNNLGNLWWVRPAFVSDDSKNVLCCFSPADGLGMSKRVEAVGVYRNFDMMRDQSIPTP